MTIPPIRLALSAVLVSAALLPLFSDPAGGQDEAHIEINAGATTKIPIHVEEFLYEGVRLIRFPTGESPEDVLVQDLEFSDFFRVSRGPSPKGATRVPPPPSDTRAIASAVLRTSWGRRVLDGQLRDAATGARIFEKSYPLGDPPERWAIHAFSDDIVLYQTGVSGVAQTRIAYVQDYGDKREIHLIDYDGHADRRLTDLGTILLSPAWSPGGDRLAFTSFGGGEAAVVGLSLRDGRTWRISPQTGMGSSPCWSPDGRRVAFTRSVGGNTEIFVADAGGGRAERLTVHPGIDTSPTFSPDGAWIAFTSDRTGAPQIYVMDRDGGALRRLTFHGKQNDSADWSPEGDRIAFVSILDRVFDICTIDAAGGSLRRLTGGEGTHENPRWAPDGRHLVYSKLHNGKRSIHVMAANGTGKRALTAGNGGQYNPAWSPGLSLQTAREVRAGQ